MQGDLISRAEVLKMLKACLSGGESQYNYVKLHIDSISTAYDMEKVVAELKEYKDLEEQGLLLRLPCKIGDVVYSITRDFISEYTICSIEKYNEGFFFNWRCEKGIYINVRGFVGHEIGKTVFLTKEEAEQMKGV